MQYFFEALDLGYGPVQALYYAMFNSIFDEIGFPDGPPRAGATTLTLKMPKKFGGAEFTVNGSNLTTDGDGKLNGGTITGLSFSKNGKTETMNLSLPIDVADLLDAGSQGSGKFNISNFKAFYDLVIPFFTEQIGDGKANKFEGNVGDDFFNGKGGADTNFMGAGNDQFQGGTGGDTIDAYQIKTNVKVNLKTQEATFKNGTTTMSSVEHATGGRGNDTLIGNNKNNKLAGNNGDDNIKGGGGKDVIISGKGNDTARGNGGADKFVFKKQEDNNKVVDFKPGVDKLVFEGFGFASKAEALAKISELGTANDDRSVFEYKGTKVVIKGADLGDLSASDILIG